MQRPGFLEEPVDDKVESERNVENLGCTAPENGPRSLRGPTMLPEKVSGQLGSKCERFAYTARDPPWDKAIEKVIASDFF